MRNPPRSAFSLVEVILALGIAVFAIVSLVALLPIGLQSSRTSVEESAALNILSTFVADRRATPLATASALYRLPALATNMTATTNTFYIADGTHAVVEPAKARYRIVCAFAPPAAGTCAPFLGYFRATWPAQSPSTNSPDYVELVVTFPQS